MDRPEIADQRADILGVLPATKTLISLVRHMNRGNIRTPARSVANLEFHHTTDDINEIASRIAALLEQRGVRATTGGAAGFPMEADRWGSKMWLISHKPVAVAAGLGHMGIHRNVIHPKFGNFVPAGNGADGCERQRIREAPRLQPVSGMQTVRLRPARRVRRPLRLFGDPAPCLNRWRVIASP